MNLKIQSVSDVHWGHRRLDGEHMRSVMQHLFPFNTRTAELDLIVIPGDFFDAAMYLPDGKVDDAITWITLFLDFCRKHGIVVRVLEGTPSHDRGQPKIFAKLGAAINLNAEKQLDIRYVDTLSTEYHEKLDRWFLYIPDECRPTTDEIWQDVVETLRTSGIDQVDYILMHGMMDYQCPPGVHSGYHKLKDYQSITKRWAFCGHIHQASKRDKFLVAGSTDRTCHGDELTKGCWYVEERDDSDHVVFLDNPKAILYKTFIVEDMSVPELHTLLTDKGVLDYPVDSNIRLKATKHSPIHLAIDEVKQQYPNLNIQLQVEGGKVSIKDALDDHDVAVDLVEINATNLAEITLAFMDEYFTYDKISIKEKLHELSSS